MGTCDLCAWTHAPRSRSIAGAPTLVDSEGHWYSRGWFFRLATSPRVPKTKPQKEKPQKKEQGLTLGVFEICVACMVTLLAWEPHHHGNTRQNALFRALPRHQEDGQGATGLDASVRSATHTHLPSSNTPSSLPLHPSARPMSCMRTIDPYVACSNLNPVSFPDFAPSFCFTAPGLSMPARSLQVG